MTTIEEHAAGPGTAKVPGENTEVRPIFSAYEVGRATIPRSRLQQDSGYDFSLPAEDEAPVEIYDLFHAYPALDFLPVRDRSGWITGYLTRKMFFASLSENQFSRDLLFRKESTIQGLVNRNIVCLNAFTSLPEASEILMHRPEEVRFDPFVVTLDRHFYGISTVDRVMRGINYFLARDMDAVLDAQKCILDCPTSGGYQERNPDYHSHVAPLNGPGGDFVKIYEMNDQFTVAVLFDVCGKGVRAAAMVSVMGSLFYTLWQTIHWSGVFNLRVLENELARANNDLVRLTAHEMYATGIVCLIDRRNHILSLFDFGHGMIWLRRQQKVHSINTMPSDSSIPDSMPFFGITENTRVAPSSYRVKPGDLILTCSDGIPEQFNYDREMYGTARLLESFAADRSSSLADTSRYILSTWDQFRGKARVKDDVSLLLLRIP